MRQKFPGPAIPSPFPQSLYRLRVLSATRQRPPFPQSLSRNPATLQLLQPHCDRTADEKDHHREFPSTRQDDKNGARSLRCPFVSFSLAQSEIHMHRLRRLRRSSKWKPIDSCRPPAILPQSLLLLNLRNL